MSHIGLYIVSSAMLLGAIGLYGLLPQPGRTRGRLVGLALAGSAITLAVLGIRHLGNWDIQQFYFWCFAIPALWGSVRVVSHRRPVYCAAYFLLVIVAVAGELVLADAEFLAAALVIIYAGAILVTYLFVIMLAQQHEPSGCDNRAREPFAAVLVAFLLAISLAQLLAEQPGSSAAAARTTITATEQSTGNVRLVAYTLLTRYAVATEIAGILLWVAIVGAIWLVTRSAATDKTSAAVGKPPGQIGREVPPF